MNIWSSFIDIAWAFIKKAWIVILVAVGILILIMYLVTGRKAPIKRRRRRRTSTIRTKTKTKRRVSVGKRKGRRIGNTYYPDTKEGRAAWSRAMRRRRAA